VWAAPMRSRPSRMIGMAFRWIGVGSTYPAARRPFTTGGASPREANGMRRRIREIDRLRGTYNAALLETPPKPPAKAPGPTRFGRAMLAHWLLDPAITYLNHGTVGAPPRRVLEAQQRIRDEIERQPSRYLLRELSSTTVALPRSSPPRLRVAAQQVAAFLGARGEDLVFVDNATTGINAVLRSFDLREGDEVLITDQAYGAIRNAASFHAGARGARVRVVELPAPSRGPSAFPEAVLAAIGPRTRLAVIDHVTSESAL